LSATAYIDLGLVFYEFLAVYAFANWIVSNDLKDSKWLYISAVMVGFSLGIKHYGVLLLAVLLIGIILKFIFSSPVSTPLLLKNLFIFGIIAFAVASPWYLDSYINTGNPVYPLLNTVFNTGSSWESRMFATTGKKGWYDGHSLSQYIFLPWQFMTGEFEGWLSPLFLFLLPLGLIIKNKSKYFKISLIFGFLFYTIYFAVVPFYTLRYFLPLLPVLSISAAYIWEEVSKSDKFLKVVCSTLIIVVFISNLGFLLFKNISVAKAAFGIESRDKYLTETLGWYGVNQYIKDNLDKNSLILVGGAPLFYYFDFNYTYGLDAEAKSAAELSRKLKEKNISYVLYLIGSIGYSDTSEYFELVYNLDSPPPKSNATRGAKLYRVR
ncbi:MAG: hypothetical protein HY776_06235, partial [Actinobacteria bacterium]|nr:hypothetical protein [Actinomycetota bacterium]